MNFCFVPFSLSFVSELRVFVNESVRFQSGWTRLDSREGIVFLFVSLPILSVAPSHPCHQLVLGAVLPGLGHLESEDDSLVSKWRLLGSSPPQLSHGFMPWNPRMRTICYLLMFWQNWCSCVTLIVACLIWYNPNTSNTCLYSVTETCRLCSLESLDYWKHFSCFT